MNRTAVLLFMQVAATVIGGCSGNRPPITAAEGDKFIGTTNS